MAKAPGQHVSTATFLAQTALPSKDKNFHMKNHPRSGVKTSGMPVISN